jgi:hypothetical protein
MQNGGSADPTLPETGFTCTLCNVWSATETDLMAHVRTARHEQAYRRAEAEMKKRVIAEGGLLGGLSLSDALALLEEKLSSWDLKGACAVFERIVGHVPAILPSRGEGRRWRTVLAMRKVIRARMRSKIRAAFQSAREAQLAAARAVVWTACAYPARHPSALGVKFSRDRRWSNFVDAVVPRRRRAATLLLCLGAAERAGGRGASAALRRAARAPRRVWQRVLEWVPVVEPGIVNDRTPLRPLRVPHTLRAVRQWEGMISDKRRARGPPGAGRAFDSADSDADALELARLLHDARFANRTALGIACEAANASAVRLLLRECETLPEDRNVCLVRLLERCDGGAPGCLAPTSIVNTAFGSPEWVISNRAAPCWTACVDAFVAAGAVGEEDIASMGYVRAVTRDDGDHRWARRAPDRASAEEQAGAREEELNVK